MGTATVAGFAFENPTTEFPVRAGPGTQSFAVVFKAAKDLSDLPVLAVQRDEANTPNDADRSRVYQWFRLRFPDGQIGWMRGHVLKIKGDFTYWGYGVVAEPTYAYLLARDENKTGPPPLKPGQEILPKYEDATSPTAEAGVTTSQPTMETEVTTTGEADVPVSGSPVDTDVIPVELLKTLSGPPTAISQAKFGIQPRKGPSSVGFDQVSFAVPYLARVPILEGQREERAQRYRWFQIEHQGQRGWLREDFVTYEGDTSALDLPTDLYPSPMTLEQYWWVRGFNYPPDIDTSTFEHWGWDQGANTGEPVLCGPEDGLVVRSFQCRNCTPDRPSVLQHGLRLGDPRIFEDEGWGFGYGNFVIVRYLSDQLPESTQDALTARDFRGGHLFVMYAHLEKRQVEAGDELTRGQPIGTCGNTGNSEATHLHLEVRASRSENFSHWAALKDGLLDPVVLFRR